MIAFFVLALAAAAQAGNLYGAPIGLAAPAYAPIGIAKAPIAYAAAPVIAKAPIATSIRYENRAYAAPVIAKAPIALAAPAYAAAPVIAKAPIAYGQAW